MADLDRLATLSVLTTANVGAPKVSNANADFGLGLELGLAREKCYVRPGAITLLQEILDPNHTARLLLYGTHLHDPCSARDSSRAIKNSTR